jgi:HEAT repeat protein
MTMRYGKTLIALSSLVAAAGAHAQAPALLHGGSVETRSAGSDLGAAIRSAAGARTEPVWIAWAVPIAPEPGDACCFSGDLRHRGGRGCRLDGRSLSYNIGNNDPRVVPSEELVVYERFEGGAASKVRAFSGDCPVEAGAERVVWLDDVQAEQSVAYLARQARELPQDDGPGDDALLALALHGDKSADVELIALAGPKSPMDVREDAIFWLGQARGRRGYQELARMADSETDAHILGKVAFSLSQSPVDEAGGKLEKLAFEHRDPEVREEAIFWAGQRDGDDMAAKLKRAAQQDPALEVRKKAVFALSQLDDGGGTTALLDLLRHGRETEIRKEALFWLGQSDDPRAIESLEALLLKK